jgi:hypothetical protein
VHTANRGRDAAPPKREPAIKKRSIDNSVTKSINKRIVGEASQRANSRNEGLVKAHTEAKLPEANDAKNKKNKRGAPFVRRAKASKSKGQ